MEELVSLISKLAVLFIVAVAIGKLFDQRAPDGGPDRTPKYDGTSPLQYNVYRL